MERKERLCLIGRNGEGKSTLLKIMSGEMAPDRGSFERMPGLKVARLAQEAPADLPGTVFDVVVEGSAMADLLREYHRAVAQAEETGEWDRPGEVQAQIEARGGWALEHRAEKIVSQFGLPPDGLFRQLSGGLKRRALLGRALMAEPDLLLLDEPTNHLDIPAIRWLEEFLQKLNCAVVFITHDRAFLRRMATRIVELDRGRLTSFACDYETYLRRKEALLEAETSERALFDRKLAQEERWIRQGVKARRTRNEGRVRALQQMRRERADRREVKAGPSFEMQEAAVSGAKVITVKGMSFAWEGRPVVKDLTTTLWRGDKIGLIGRNGSGKTTLLKLLLGQLQPEKGTVKHGTQLNVAYFDQHRQELNPEARVQDAVADGYSHVTVGGQKRHVLTYLEDFLFAPDRARQPVKSLSGGERNRLLLARLFARESNLLVMDEPTNDLDLETLELLEAQLVSYQGTLLLVSHDRDFLNNVVTGTLALEGGGLVRETDGGYEAWERVSGGFEALEARAAARGRSQEPEVRSPERGSANPGTGSREGGGKARKLINRETRELEALPAKIEDLERRQAGLVEAMGRPEFYQGKAADPAGAAAQLQAMERDLQALYRRWEELEALKG